MTPPASSPLAGPTVEAVTSPVKGRSACSARGSLCVLRTRVLLRRRTVLPPRCKPRPPAECRDRSHPMHDSFVGCDRRGPGSHQEGHRRWGAERPRFKPDCADSGHVDDGAESRETNAPRGVTMTSPTRCWADGQRSCQPRGARAASDDVYDTADSHQGDAGEPIHSDGPPVLAKSPQSSGRHLRPAVVVEIGPRFGGDRHRGCAGRRGRRRRRRGGRRGGGSASGSARRRRGWLRLALQRVVEREVVDLVWNSRRAAKRTVDEGGGDDVALDILGDLPPELGVRRVERALDAVAAGHRDVGCSREIPEHVGGVAGVHAGLGGPRAGVAAPGYVD